MSKPAVFALVDNEPQAERTVSALESAGFLRSDISILSQSATGRRLESDPNNVLTTERDMDTSRESNREVGHVNATKAPEGTTAGVITGGTAGAVAGWLIGIGALAIPGVGPFIAAGPILAALSGAAIGAAAGGLTGALVGYGIPEYEAKLYAGRWTKVIYSSESTPSIQSKPVRPRRPSNQWGRTTSRQPRK